MITDDIAGYAELRRRSSIPISGGEHEFTLAGFRDLLDAKALDVIQFDTNRVGGISQARKMTHEEPKIAKNKRRRSGMLK